MDRLAHDSMGRPLTDLRISVTDRCNFRCSYCMPAEIFDGNWDFLPRMEMLTYEEMAEIATAISELGVTKIRLTGGEPLLRRDINKLVAMLKERLPHVELAMTTNGSLLERHAMELADAGLDRITISLDALEPDLFRQLSGSSVELENVLNGIDAAVSAGLHPIKLNCVIRRGVNENQMIPMIERFSALNIMVRFIEFMDVGNTNSWRMTDVVTSAEMLEILNRTYTFRAIDSERNSDVARLWEDADSGYRIGIISSISQPFCGDCSRARLSADGQLFTCLFSSVGHDIKSVLRREDDVGDEIRRIWNKRDDRFSEIRSNLEQNTRKVEMSYLGG